MKALFLPFVASAAATAQVTLLRDYPKYESSIGPNGQRFGDAASAIQSQLPKSVPMIASKNYPLEITNRVEANFQHVQTQNVIGAKMIMETTYPTYNLNNNDQVISRFNGRFKL